MADFSVPTVPVSLRVAPTEDQIRRLERAMIHCEDMPKLDIEAATSHHFCIGLYGRELRVPKGYVVVGKKHAQENFFLLAAGEMTVWTAGGMRRVKAPFMIVTQPGDKRVGYAHEDCVTYNFHPNADNCRDMAELERRFIVPELLERDEPELLEGVK